MADCSNQIPYPRTIVCPSPMQCIDNVFTRKWASVSTGKMTFFNQKNGCRESPGTCLARPQPVAQAFQPAGSRNFLVPRWSRRLELGTGKSPEPAHRNVCATALDRYALT